MDARSRYPMPDVPPEYPSEAELTRGMVGGSIHLTQSILATSKYLIGGLSAILQTFARYAQLMGVDDEVTMIVDELYEDVRAMEPGGERHARTSFPVDMRHLSPQIARRAREFGAVRAIERIHIYATNRDTTTTIEDDDGNPVQRLDDLVEFEFVIHLRLVHPDEDTESDVVHVSTIAKWPRFLAYRSQSTPGYDIGVQADIPRRHIAALPLVYDMFVHMMGLDERMEAAMLRQIAEDIRSGSMYMQFVNDRDNARLASSGAKNQLRYYQVSHGDGFPMDHIEVLSATDRDAVFYRMFMFDEGRNQFVCTSTNTVASPLTTVHYAWEGMPLQHEVWGMVPEEVYDVDSRTYTSMGIVKQTVMRIYETVVPNEQTSFKGVRVVSSFDLGGGVTIREARFVVMVQIGRGDLSPLQSNDPDTGKALVFEYFDAVNPANNHRRGVVYHLREHLAEAIPNLADYQLIFPMPVYDNPWVLRREIHARADGRWRQRRYTPDDMVVDLPGLRVHSPTYIMDMWETNQVPMATQVEAGYPILTDPITGLLLWETNRGTTPLASDPIEPRLSTEFTRRNE